MTNPEIDLFPLTLFCASCARFPCRVLHATTDRRRVFHAIPALLQCEEARESR
jgi:hypothetical protein